MFPTEDITTSDLFKINKIQGITGSQLRHVIWMGKCLTYSEKITNWTNRKFTNIFGNDKFST